MIDENSKGDGVEAAMSKNWLPRQGQPSTLLEKLAHNVIRLIAWLPIYTAIIATLTLLVVLFGVPCVGK